MKYKLLMTMVAVAVCCTSCVKVNLGSHNKLSPSDNIVKNEYKMEPFSKVDIDLVAKVKFVQSTDNDYRVLMKCPDNYVDLFEFKTEGDELKVVFADKRHASIEANDVAIVICAPTLSKLDSDGVASISIDSLTTPSLQISSEGVGNIMIKKLETLFLSVKSSGVGNMELEGKALKAAYECNGVGSINAEKLEADDVKAEVNGVGSITCFASQRLKGEVNGIGSLKYGGHPAEKQLRRNGVGSFSEI